MNTLTPSQQKAFDSAVAAAQPGHVVVLVAPPGNGKTTLLRSMQEQLGGRRIGAGELQAAVAAHHPLAVEDALFETIDEALDDSTVVLVDDIDLVTQVVEGCHSYPRGGFVRVPLSALAERAASSGHTIVVTASMPTQSLVTLGQMIGVSEFGVDDYRAVCSAYLTPAQQGAVDFPKVHRFARRMTARQLRRACEGVQTRLKEVGGDVTDAFIEYLKLAQLVSNVDLGEVQTVKLEDLKGLDDVIRALEANVVLPLEHSELATELSLKPKRGVLLVGPPGTGKTTIGRALAHRLRGKFFLVDGTVIAGTPMFYHQLNSVFQAAMRNAPAVVFIDDSDVIFEGQDPGLYRYLLTMLDGLESESAGGVCLMLTSMDIGSLPPALVRSGRIELWLETRLPDEPARAALLRDLCKQIPASAGAVDVDELATATTELSGADLKRLVDDGKLLFAFDRARGLPQRPMAEYFSEALQTVRENRLRYAQAEAVARARTPVRPSPFNVPFMPAAVEAAGHLEQVAFVHMKRAEL